MKSQAIIIVMDVIISYYHGYYHCCCCYYYYSAAPPSRQFHFLALEKKNNSAWVALLSLTGVDRLELLRFQVLFVDLFQILLIRGFFAADAPELFWPTERGRTPPSLPAGPPPPSLAAALDVLLGTPAGTLQRGGGGGLCWTRISPADCAT